MAECRGEYPLRTTSGSTVISTLVILIAYCFNILKDLLTIIAIFRTFPFKTREKELKAREESKDQLESERVQMAAEFGEIKQTRNTYMYKSVVG
jgi:hypothetical protein